jgi:hypothetical protein
MAYTPDFEEHLRLCQLLHESSEQPKYYPGNFAMQPPAFAVGHPPVLSTNWALYSPSMNHAAASNEPKDWPHYKPWMSDAAAFIGPKDWPVYNPSMIHAAASNEPKDWPVYSPSMIHASASIGSKDGLLYSPSMSHAAASLDPNWTMHATTGNPVVDNSYQSSIRSSSTMQYRATGRTEDHLSPGQTTVRMQSSMPSLSPQETTTPPNEHNMQFASTMRYRTTEVGTEDNLSPGRTSSHTQSSASSPSTPETTTRPNENNFEVVTWKQFCSW